MGQKLRILGNSLFHAVREREIVNVVPYRRAGGEQEWVAHAGIDLRGGMCTFGVDGGRGMDAVNNGGEGGNWSYTWGWGIALALTTAVYSLSYIHTHFL